MKKIILSKEEKGKVIGKKGKNKEKIEKKLGVRLKIEDDMLSIEGKEEIEEYIAIQVIRALTLGFSIDEALLLKNSDYSLKIINIKNYVRKARLKAVKGRIIGKKGKAKRIIEELTDTYVAIKDNQIGIIGKAENIELASKAIYFLIKGSSHAKVYKFLEMSRSSLEGLEEEIEEKKKEWEKEYT